MKRLFHKTVLSLALLLVLPLNSSAISRGNADGTLGITINDVTVIIDKLLSNGEYSVLCDPNYDGVISISDVTELIDYLLTGEWTSPGYSGPAVPDNAELYTVNGVSFAMIPIEGGTFIYGGGYTGGTPREETVSDFSIGLTEVTQELWEAVMGENPSLYQLGAAIYPVTNVTFHDCKEFASKLSEMTGVNFCLPNPIQWQYAALGGQLSHYYMYAGSDDIDEVAWYDGAIFEPYPVGLKKPNELGIYDMSGNVSEWVEREFGGINEPTLKRQVKGGNSVMTELYCRLTYIWYNDPYEMPMMTGMRLVICP
jgi:hypothetical protein